MIYVGTSGYSYDDWVGPYYPPDLPKQEWLSFYFKSPMCAPELYPEHDLFIQLMKLKNTLRYLKGEELITHLGLEYYD